MKEHPKILISTSIEESLMEKESKKAATIEKEKKKNKGKKFKPWKKVGNKAKRRVCHHEEDNAKDTDNTNKDMYRFTSFMRTQIALGGIYQNYLNISWLRL